MLPNHRLNRMATDPLANASAHHNRVVRGGRIRQQPVHYGIRLTARICYHRLQSCDGGRESARWRVHCLAVGPLRDPLPTSDSLDFPPTLVGFLTLKPRSRTAICLCR